MAPAHVRAQLREDGFCIIPNVLSPSEVERVQTALNHGVELARQAGQVHTAIIDPNAANLRVYNLPALDPVFLELLTHPRAVEFVTEVVGQNFLVSNFSANIALPGSGSMRLHSDQALVVPPPWIEPWAVNIIWCLDDVHEANGATRYLPGSHRYKCFEELPPDPLPLTRPFEASAGSFIVMEGRLWHTSGANVTRDERRAMAFAYYTTDFLRPQLNWDVALPQAVQASMTPQTRKMFGLGAEANTRIGTELVRLTNTET